jgi:hypothetical protein
VDKVAVTLTHTGALYGGGGGYGGTSGGTGGAGLGLGYGMFENGGNITGGAGGGGVSDGGIGGDGVDLTGGTITNDGVITGGAGGAANDGRAGGAGIVLARGAVTNDTTIIGGTGGAGDEYGGHGGNGVNLASGTATNDGTITGGTGGIGIYAGTAGAGVDVTGGAFTNDGSILGGTGGAGMGNGRFGLEFGGAGGTGAAINGGTLINAGTITGGAGGVGSRSTAQAGVAVQFGSVAGTLVIYPDAVFNGNVMANASVNDALVLAGTDAGTLNGLGTDYSGFTTLLETAGADWMLAGANSFGGTANIAGALTVAGTLDLTGTMSVASGLVVTGGVTVAAGATLSGNGGSGADVNGGTLTNAGTIAGSDAVRFGAGAGTLIVDPGAVFMGDVVANASVSDVLVLAGATAATLDGLGGQFSGFSTLDFAAGATWTVDGTEAGLTTGQVINGFTGQDTIVLENFVESGYTYIAGTGLELTELTDPTTLDFIGKYTDKEFKVTTDGTNTTIAICYLLGTRILTPTGEVPVEELEMGDRVVTRFGGIQTIKWIGRQTYDPRFIRKNKSKIPVHITAGALGDNMPARDLFVSPGHSMLLGDVLVLARDLVNGVTVTQDLPAGNATVAYYQLDLGAHDCVIAEGCWSETYADAPGLRAQFHNAAEYDALYPDMPPADELSLCAPRPEHGKPLIEALRPILEIAAASKSGALEGYLDMVENFTIHGWARDVANPDVPVLLDVWLGHELLGSVLAREPRDDLEAAGKGACAFRFAAPRRLSEKCQQNLNICRATDGAMLIFANARPGRIKKLVC